MLAEFIEKSKQVLEKPQRLTKDEFFDLLTLFYASRGTCDRLRTATTLRDQNGIFLSGGYNGSIPGAPHCDDPGVGHLMVEGHCLRTNHGEDNALLNCLDLSRIEGGTATIIGSPCYPCARKLIGKGIKHMRYIGSYKCLGSDEVQELCAAHNVRLEFVEPQLLINTLSKALKFLQGPGGPLKNIDS